MIFQGLTPKNRKMVVGVVVQPVSSALILPDSGVVFGEKVDGELNDANELFDEFDKIEQKSKE